MSVLIKGMKMPKAGNWKTIRIYYDGTCAEPNWQGDCKIMKGCEAVPIPDHGDLIDRNLLIGGFADWYIQESPMYLGDNNVVAEMIGDAMKAIEAAPAVIPAERSEASLCDNCDERSDVGCSWCKKMESSEE